MLSRVRRGAIAAVLAGVVVVGVALAGFGVASALVPMDASEPVSSLALEPDGSGASIPVVAADPASGTPWAIRVYRSKTGLTCPEAGRVQGQIRDGEFGQVDEEDGKFRQQRPEDAAFGQVDPRDGKFYALPLEAAGSCADLNKAPSSIAVNHYPAEGLRGARAVVFGVTTSAVSAVRLEIDGKPQRLQFSADAYIGVMNDDEANRAVLVFTMVDGTTKSVRLAAVTPPARQPPPDS
jgi:hypothetical protein